MKSHTKTNLVVLGFVVVVVVSLSTWAGDLNPPPGPISPTMRSLDEIYNAVHANSAGCPPCVWKTRFVEDEEGLSEFEVDSGSGVVHRFINRSQDSLILSNGPLSNGGQILAVEPAFTYTARDSGITLDVAYDDGLYINGSCFLGTTGTMGGMSSQTISICPDGRIRAQVFFKSTE